MVDGNNKTKDVVHSMIAKPAVEQITNEYLKNSGNNSTAEEEGLMTFSLIPSKNGSMSMGGAMNHTMPMDMPM
jgi:hypothetical protein